MANLFTLPQQYVSDQSGEPLMGAKLYFYEVATSTPKATYTDAALTVANENPVVADAYGVFPVIWLDDAGTDYRVTLTDQFDVVQRITDGLLSTKSPAALLADLLTVDGPGSGLNADLLDGIDSLEFAQRSQAQSIAGQWSFVTVPTMFGVQMGFRHIPFKYKTAQHTLELEDNGWGIANTNGGFLIPTFASVAYSAGTAITLVNDSAVNQTLDAVTPATTTIRLAGTTSTGSRVLLPRAEVLVHMLRQDEWYVLGAGCA